MAHHAHPDRSFAIDEQFLDFKRRETVVLRHQPPVVLLPQRQRRALRCQDAALPIFSQCRIGLRRWLSRKIAQIRTGFRRAAVSTTCRLLRSQMCPLRATIIVSHCSSGRPKRCAHLRRLAAIQPAKILVAAVPQRTIRPVQHAPDEPALQIQWLGNPVVRARGASTTRRRLLDAVTTSSCLIDVNVVPVGCVNSFSG